MLVAGYAIQKSYFWCVWCAGGKLTEDGAEAPIHVGAFVILYYICMCVYLLI